MRSLTEPPGLKYSTLASTCDPGSALVTERSRTRGVSPTSSASESYTCMVVLFLAGPTLSDPGRCPRPSGRSSQGHTLVETLCEEAGAHARSSDRRDRAVPHRPGVQ